MKTVKETEIYRKILTENSIQCKHCGRKMAMKPCLNKEICSWCGHYVFRTPKHEFEYRLNEKMKRSNK